MELNSKPEKQSTVRILRADTDPNPNTNTNNPALTNSNSNNPTLNNLTNPAPSSQLQSQDPGPNPLAIALPILFGLLTALAMASYALLKRHKPDVLRRLTLAGPRFWWWRRGGPPAAAAGLSGYGERKWGQGREGQQKVRLRGRDVEIKVVKTDLEGLRANAGRMEMEMGMGMGEMERGRF
ncbi:hypothetical protein NEMBOFW57_007051 [Staphylotrichum longicolle]|uniref:Uncharacterized protein n=1 Tax=Staphylotrichum longicolle TaxID=669026 RepID=A0AAD4HUX8_9PEZI|nr:hypothetical protein NEMBOFW57_007051 [Staphylotrichum longicolle]